MIITTERLTITEFKTEMARSVSDISKDENNRKFMPDEVFETKETAERAIVALTDAYGSDEGPYVYAILLNGGHIGHVELVKAGEKYEVGYHIGNAYCGNGYATEALISFIPYVKKLKNIGEIYGICDASNAGSKRVLEKAGFKLDYEGTGSYHGERTDICIFSKNIS